MAITITCDFHADWMVYLRAQLQAFGYDPSRDSDEEVRHCFFNLQKRLIQPAPRAVLKSAEFVCPPTLIPGLHLVEGKITRGEDLRPHLSRLLKKSDFNDGMLNDWGIHHLHLGTTLEPDGFVKRSEPVLFARFDRTTAYFVGMQPHGAWALQENVRILHRNWPNSIQHLRLIGAIAVAGPRTDQDIKVLRSKNTNSAVEADGVFYVALGGGIMSSGLAVQAVIQSDRWSARIKELESDCRRDAHVFEEAARSNGHTLPAVISLRFEIHDDKALVVEPSTGLAFDLGPLSL